MAQMRREIDDFVVLSLYSDFDILDVAVIQRGIDERLYLQVAAVLLELLHAELCELVALRRREHEAARLRLAGDMPVPV